MMETVNEDCYVDWFPTGAAAWRRDVIERFPLDGYFKGYSYLEDLDFSFTVRKHYRLAVVAAARYHHFPSPSGRMSQYKFGRMEVANRLYFVRKHGLSVARCCVGIAIRLFLTVSDFVRHARIASLQRAAGNIAELGSRVCRGPLQCFRRNGNCRTTAGTDAANRHECRQSTSMTESDSSHQTDASAFRESS